MKFVWQNDSEQTLNLKSFLKQHGVSGRLLSKLRNGQGALLLDDQKVTLNAKVLARQKVTLQLPAEPDKPEVLVSHEPVKIVYEDQNWLVVDKPAGLTSVPGPSNQADTLVNRVKGYLLRQKAENINPHIITRLDRYTSGLVLFAKNTFAQSLINQKDGWQCLDKRYLALVSGQIKQTHGTIELPLGKKEGEIKRQVMRAGQDAKTEYWCKQHLKDGALLEIKLHTGRTHQIRAHFSHLGHPLLGDELYGGSLMLKRQALHAYQLTFKDPLTGQKHIFISPLPDDMQLFLQ